MTTIIENLEVADPLRAPVLRRAIRALPIAPGSRGLDVGCGVGRQALLLAEAVGPAGHVLGLDLRPELLRYAEGLARESWLGPRVSFMAGTMERLPCANRSLDWAWSADCLGYPAGDARPALHELARVVRPGGLIALLGWTSQLLLPGYPLLEANLNATCSSYAPLLRDQPPEAHFLRLTGQLRAVGVDEVRITTLVGEAQAPLRPEQRRALAALCAMLWGAPGPGTAPADWEALQRLCDPESPDCIFDRPDYYACFTYTSIAGWRGQVDLDSR